MRLVIIFGIAVALISCSKKTTPTATKETVKVEEEQKPLKVEESMLIDYAKMNYTAATVIDMSELDGCGYMLKLDNGKKLQPTPALAGDFKVNDMPVWIKYQVKKGAVGICMSGQIVTLTSIAKK